MDARFQPLCVLLANQFIALVNLHLRHNLEGYLNNPEFQFQLQSSCRELYSCFNLNNDYNVSEWLLVNNLLSKELIELPIIEIELVHYRTDMQRFQHWLDKAAEIQFCEKDFSYLVESLRQAYQSR